MYGGSLERLLSLVTPWEKGGGVFGAGTLRERRGTRVVRRSSEGKERKPRTTKLRVLTLYFRVESGSGFPYQLREWQWGHGWRVMEVRRG